jgi:xylulokinase
VSPLWRQILADVLDAEIAIPSTSEGAAYGAAVLAGVGVGWYATVDEACAAMVSAKPMAQPGSDQPGYAASYELYRSIYPALADSFHQLATRPD